MGMFGMSCPRCWEKNCNCSTYDLNNNAKFNEGYAAGVKHTEERYKEANPDPSNFTIRSSTTFKNAVVLVAHYPNCKNFEGDKIMVYLTDNPTIFVSRIRNVIQKLDPHFNEHGNISNPSPIARFEPTGLGYKLACVFAQSL